MRTFVMCNRSNFSDKFASSSRNSFELKDRWYVAGSLLAFLGPKDSIISIKSAAPVSLLTSDLISLGISNALLNGARHSCPKFLLTQFFTHLQYYRYPMFIIQSTPFNSKARPEINENSKYRENSLELSREK